MSTTDHRETTDSGQTAGRIRVRTHDLDDLEDVVDDWSSLSKYERWLVTQEPDELSLADLDPPDDLDAERLAELATIDPPEPTQVIETTNTTVDGLNEYLVDNLDPNQTADKDASHLAVGDDGGSGTSSGDSSLNNEQARVSTTDEIDNGKDLKTSTFLDSTEANGVDIDEVALFTASTGGTMLNHSAISVINKTANDTATIDVILEFRAA